MPRNYSKRSTLRSKRSSREQQEDENDDDDNDDYYYQSTATTSHNSQSMTPLDAAAPDELYESDGGWSDDSGKDSDAYVESHRGSMNVRNEHEYESVNHPAVFDATKDAKRKAGVATTTPTKSRRKEVTKAGEMDHAQNDASQQQLKQQNYYHDAAAPAAANVGIHQHQHNQHPVIDQAVSAQSETTRAALVAGYAAAEYDNDHTVTHEQMELHQQQQQYHDVKDSETRDGKTFKSTALTEQEQKLRYTLTCLIVGLTLAVIIVAGLVGGIVGSVVFANNNQEAAANAANASPTIVPVSSMPPTPIFNTDTFAPSRAPRLTLRPTSAPTVPPLVTNPALYDSILTSIPGSDKDILTDGTPQNLAFVSVQNENLALDVPRLLQRYAMRVFYYSTNGPSSWIDATNWESTEDECTWYTSATDVTSVCSLGQVLQTLELNGNNVTGTLPAELSMLTGLTRLYIKGVSGTRGLTGSIPESLNQLKNMSVVVLNDHQFQSSIPDSILSAWSQLTVINIIGSGLSGTIPSTVGSLTLCSNFLLDSNALTGTFPAAVSSMSSLAAFGITGNQLSGTLPELSIAPLKTFNVSSNLLTGPLPSFAGLPSVVKLGLDGNNFTGSLDFCGSTETVVDCGLTCTCSCTCV
ncbi:hypothetical protein MPSEU_000032600 [Mayamaea pseudoterrestris]|nr:hypothetical protein MPSEU_000032600 [Mayamaea pseudoterrestris]